MTPEELRKAPNGLAVKIEIAGLGSWTTKIDRKNICQSLNAETRYYTSSCFVSARDINVLSEAEIKEQYQKSLENLKQSYESKLKALKEYKKEVK